MIYSSVTFYRLRIVLILWLISLGLNGCMTPATVEQPTSPQPPSSGGTEIYHTVQRGETLYGISQRYGRDPQQLVSWNNIQAPYTLIPGQVLLVSGPSGNQGIPVNPPQPSQPEPIIDNTPPTPEEPQITEDGYHLVRAGETLYGIASVYGHDFRDVAAWNEIDPPYNLTIGQPILVIKPTNWQPTPQPTYQQPVSQPQQTKPLKPKPSRDEDYYIVQPGDTLYGLAIHYGYGLADLATWNGLQAPYPLSIGQKLRVSPPPAGSEIPAPKPSPRSKPKPTPKPVAPKPSGGTAPVGYHAVAPGETLYAISRMYNISIQNLAQWNNLAPPYPLSVGQQLRLTAPKTSAGGSSSSGRSNNSIIPVATPNRTDYHIVKKGETLKSIAKKYRIPLGNLADWNGIGSPYTIYPGLRLNLISP